MHSLVYAADKNYWIHLYVSMYSLLRNNLNSEFIVYILTDEYNEEFASYMSLLSDMGNMRDYIIIEVDSSIAASYPLGYHFTKLTYYRLFIGQLLPEDLKKVLYLDCDTIVDDSLEELFNTSLNGKVLSAVPDKGSLYDSRRLNLPEGVSYFNAGVMLIDLEKWRNLNVESKLLAYIENNPAEIKFADQDALNAILYDKYKELSPQFNFHEWGKKLNRGGAEVIYPNIIHYVDYPKPWYYLSDHPLKEKYWSYLKDTPYHYYREPDRNLKNFFLKTFNRMKKNVLWFIKGRRILYRALLYFKHYIDNK